MRGVGLNDWSQRGSLSSRYFKVNSLSLVEAQLPRHSKASEYVPIGLFGGSYVG